jgi:Transposase DDE domain group 1
VKCHAKATPSVVTDWRLSEHAGLGIECESCHGSDHMTFADTRNAKLPTAETCGHTRHTFSIQEAKSPQACKTCQFCGDHLLGARLRPSNIDASAGSLEEVQRIVRQIRAKWPTIRIILRADSGFCGEELLTWYENSDVDYVFGFARNKRLRRIIGRAMQEAKQEH